VRQLTPVQRAAIAAGFAPEPIVTAASASGTGPGVRLPVLEGAVRWTAASTERTTAELVVPTQDTDGTTYAPTSWASLLTPDDCVVTVAYGLGVDGPVRVARLWVDDVRTERPEGRTTLQLVSRATRVSQAGFPSGDRRYVGPTADVVHRIVEQCLGTTVQLVDKGIGGPLVAPGTVFDGDPWQAVEDLCDAAGGEAYFDELDQLVLRPTPGGAGPAVDTLRVGPGGTITRYSVSLTRAPNVVRLQFQHPTRADVDVVGRATATGAVVPTGPYGPYRVTETRTGAVTQAQADAAAREYLTRAGGMLRSLELETVPHPGLEVGDTIGVELVTGALELHRVIGLELPLTPGNPSRIETRATPWAR
jgi:hypothetical protein